MPKPDSPPLLTAGIHRMTLPELEQLAVSPFPDDDQRQRLFLLFQQWVSNLQTKYVSAILWIDGSYPRGLFGFQHDGKSAKGFVELSI
ncbi:hypothetical protein RugamoR57_33090 [Duganella caerulea]|uniref:DUF6932 family protein n=1 Tax=Duganella caerulea TaxID=2885762 RepID=UPI0030E7545C